MPPVPSPYQERVVEDTAVHADGPVYVVPGEGGGAYDHAVGDVVVPAFLRHLRRQPQIVPVERRHVLRPGDVAGTHLTPAVRDNSVHGDGVILHQLPSDRQHVELLDAAGRPSDTPAHQHIQLQPFPPAEPDEPRHIHCLYQRDHRHRRVHPQPERGRKGMKNFLLERLSLYLQTKSSGAMKKIVCLLISAFLFCFCSAQNRADDSSCYNMNIDSVKGGNPKGQGYCLSIKSPDEKKSYFGSWSNTISERFDGRKLTLSGYIKTKAVNNGYAGIWIRVDPDVSFANMSRNGVKGDSDWKRYELTVPYSQSAEQIVFGGMLIGDGQAWFDNFSISIDGVPLCQLNVRAVNAPEKSDSVFYGQLLHGGLSDSQAMRLFDLCKLWGAMKYTHPDVMNGDIDVDVELAKILPAVINAGNEDSIPVLLREWCKPSNISGTDNGVAPEWAYSNTSAYVKDLINSFWSADFSRESHYIRLERNSVPNFQHEKDSGMPCSIIIRTSGVFPTGMTF